MANIYLKENERIDDLEYKDLKIIQKTDGFCFGMDAVLLSDFSKNIKKGSKVIDLGTGTGILPILLSQKTNLEHIVGVEIQEEIAEMAKRSVTLNDLDNKIEILNTDLKKLHNIYEKGTFNVVVMNPPYKKNETGAKNENILKLISRHEIKANLEDFIKQASYLLIDKGEVYIVHRPERLVDLMELLRKYKLEPKILRFVQPNINTAANIVLIKAVKNGKQFLKLQNNLIIYDDNGNYTDEVLMIYNKK